MTKRMLIDATHTEETRVAVVEDNKLSEFDYESTVRKQLKGSIFLAKVTRVEPSLQAAFVNFGGNRHGFLPFSEIHPDYYRIPISDREALLAAQREEMEAMQAAEEAADRAEAEAAGLDNEDGEDIDDETDIIEDTETVAKDVLDETEADDSTPEAKDEKPAKKSRGRKKKAKDDETAEDTAEEASAVETVEDEESAESAESDNNEAEAANDDEDNKQKSRRSRRSRGGRSRRSAASSRRVEMVGGDEVDGERPPRPSLRNKYKIQEVVKRGQIMLIQASKEERGNKGAAVTTYLSLPGRYCVLMPNSPRGGGVSRKIANYKDRRRMRDMLSDLSVPDGMSVIMRTAGVERTKAEIKRDLDYLVRLWNNIRETTLQSTAPALIHEEGHLIRRSIRDIYTRDVEEVLVAGHEGYKTAHDFMKMMIPSHAKRVQQYEDEKIPLFHRYQVEKQIAGMGDPEVTLKSGGSIVINPTEALVSIDVNSGRATKERHIEETALKTNLEAADEVARQLRLRDLGGLVVIDFIDMEDRRNNRKVEQRLKQALSTDRARIQVGRISAFGLMEMSRQRLNPSLTEAQFERCPHCQGVGYVRTIDSAAITVLRALEEEGIRRRAAEIALHIPNSVALYILNNKRDILADIENRYEFKVLIHVDNDLPPSDSRIEVIKTTQDQQREAENAENKTENKPENRIPPAEQAEDDDSEKSTSKRSRRGGRNHSNKNRKDRTDESPAENNTGDNNAETVTEAPETPSRPEEAETKDNEKTEKKSRSRRRPKKETTDDKETVKEEKAETPKPEEKPATEKAKEEKKPRSRTAKKDKPANESEPPAPKEYETVNQKPDTKKKGWWNRLMD